MHPPKAQPLDLPPPGPRSPGLRTVVEMNPMYLFRWEEPQQAFVLLYPEGVVKLNGSAGAVLGAVDGERSVADIAALLSARYGDADLSSDVLEFMETAYAQGWIRTKS